MLPEQNVDPRLVARYVLEYSKEQDNMIKFQLETKEQLEAFKYDILGMEYSEENEKYIRVDTKDALINEKGANAIIGLLKPDVSKIVSLSDFNDVEIDNMALEDLNEFTYFLVRHKNEYDIKSLQSVSVILGRINKMNYSIMKKARLAGERDTLRKGYQITQSDTKLTQEQPKTPGFFAGLIK